MARETAAAAMASPEAGARADPTAAPPAGAPAPPSDPVTERERVSEEARRRRAELLDRSDRLEFERFHQWLRLTFAPAPLLVVLAHGPAALPQALLTALAVVLSYGWVWLLLRRWPGLLLRYQVGLRVVDVALAYVVLQSIHGFMGDAYYDSVYMLFVVAAAATHGPAGVAVLAPVAGAAAAIGRIQLILAGVLPLEFRHVTDPVFYALFFVAVGGAVAFLMRRSGEVVERRELAWRSALAEQNAALERTAGQLRVANRELEAFAYSVSHDLRAPLRAIDGFGQVLLHTHGDRLDARGQDYLNRIRLASQRMGQLIDDLLMLSRVSRAEMRREPVDLSSLARLVADELRRTDPAREVEFEIQPGVRAVGDARLLRVALENLLGNAWKFTSGRARARVQFGLTSVDGAPAYVVRDDGAGFDMSYAGKLFGAFQRLHSAGEFEGTGVGLATVQRIVHKHGGRIWAEGRVGEGAAFYFTLDEAG